MKIAIIGYGKMGHAIERIALERGHQIVAVIDAGNAGDIDTPTFATADVAIEFTTPATAPGNVERSVCRGVPVVCGSTGWYDQLPRVEAVVKESGSALLASSNFSLGVYVFNRLSRSLASMMERLDQYRPCLSETHHVHKLDHPSGTAITIAEGILASCPRLHRWTEEGVVWTDTPEAPAQLREALEAAGQAPADTLPVVTYRKGETPGTHTVEWASAVDTITVEHRADSRDGFALGAVIAAEWLAHRKGVFTLERMMQDIL